MLAAALSLAAAVGLPLLTLAAYADVTYVYDADGHLIAVGDGSGNAVTFTYDLDGNLIAIKSSNGESIFQVSPNNGTAGTAVTIYGNGFSATPTVSFNGTAATVSSSTSTTIFTTVPSGATTGPVSVDSIAGPTFTVD